MDFSNRNVQSNHLSQSGGGPGAQVPGQNVNQSANRKNRSDKGKWTRVGVVVVVVAVAVLIIGVAASAAWTGKTEDSYVDTSKLQAVFLNTGQVYFGNVTALNDKYFVLQDIYYLQTNSNGSSSSSSSSSNNVSLVKLGCELHRPYDQMVINRSSVTFWENLQSDGQVAQAVAKFQQQNPHGQQCSDQSASSGSTSNTAQPANTTNGSSTPASTPSTSTTKP